MHTFSWLIRQLYKNCLCHNSLQRLDTKTGLCDSQAATCFCVTSLLRIAKRNASNLSSLTITYLCYHNVK